MFLLAKNWWSLLLRGTLSILFGVLTLMWPGLTLGALVTGFGVYAFIDGVVNIVGVVRHSRQHQRWASLLIEGIAGILAGVVTIAWPAITLAVLVTLVAVWAIVTGVLEIVAAIRLRKHMHGEWLLALGGIAFGVLVLAAPLAGALVLPPGSVPTPLSGASS